MVTQGDFSPPHSRTWYKVKILNDSCYDITFIGVDNKRTLPSKEMLEYGEISRVHSGGIYGISLPILDNPLQILQILINALKANAEVYHIFGLPNILVGVFLKILGKKVIYDISDDDPSYNTFPSFIQTLIRHLEGFFMKFYDVIATVTDQLREDRLRYHSNIKILRHCPNPNFNPNNIPAYKNNTNTIVYIGQITWKKGIYELLDSLPLIIKQINNLKLLLVGRIPKNEKEIIERKISKKNLSDHVDIREWLPHTEIPKYINQGKLGLVLSRPWCYAYKICVPNKFIEYMACGIPVIANKELIEVRKIVEREKCGLLVDSNNIKEIAEAIVYLLKHDKIREKMGERARKYIEKYYNWKILEDDLLEIYTSL